jgi:hypothetical protein
MTPVTNAQEGLCPLTPYSHTNPFRQSPVTGALFLGAPALGVVQTG